MLNAWDFVFGAGLGLSAWLGWKLKSLPLLGAGFAVALSPWVAERAWLAGLPGLAALKARADLMVWWLLLALAAGLLMLLFIGLSKMLKALRLEFLDRGFGAAVCAGIFLSILSLNVGGLRLRVHGDARMSLLKSWTWKHLRMSKEPAWIEALEQKAAKLKLPQKP